MFKAKLIYTSPKRKTFVKIRDISLSFILILNVLLRIDIVRLFFEKLFGENIVDIILYILIISLLILVTFYFLSRKNKQIGKLSMSEEKLTISTEKNTLSFNINQLKSFIIKTSYFMPNEELVGLYTSYNNLLIFEYKDTKYSYRFTIESFYRGNQFKKLVDYWKKNNNNFTLIEEIA